MEELVKHNYVVCDKCGWVHFEVSRAFAENAIKEFNTFFETLTQEKKDEYYGGKGCDLSQYDQCNVCGGSYKNMHDATPEEIPYGSTIGPVINRNE